MRAVKWQRRGRQGRLAALQARPYVSAPLDGQTRSHWRKRESHAHDAPSSELTVSGEEAEGEEADAVVVAAEIRSVYAGTRYHDTCISEVRNVEER